MRYYIALAQSSPRGGFTLSLPDFPSWRAAARSIDEARAAASRGLARRIEDMLAYGETVPEPSSFADLIADPRYRGCETLLVAAPPLDRRDAADAPFHRISNDEWPEASA